MNKFYSAAKTALFAIVLATVATNAEAQQLCLLHDVAVEKLMQQHDEQVIGRGLASNGQRMVEVFVSPDGSWTLTTTDIQGRTCVMASGDSWMEVQPVIGDPA